MIVRAMLIAMPPPIPHRKITPDECKADADADCTEHHRTERLREQQCAALPADVAEAHQNEDRGDEPERIRRVHQCEITGRPGVVLAHQQRQRDDVRAHETQAHRDALQYGYAHRRRRGDRTIALRDGPTDVA